MCVVRLDGFQHHETKVLMHVCFRTSMLQFDMFLFLARSYRSVMNSNHMSNLKLNTSRHARESSAGGLWQTKWGIDLSQNWLIDGNVIICENKIQTSDWRSGGMTEVEVYSAGRSLKRRPDAGNVYTVIVDPKIPSIHFWTAGEQHFSEQTWWM